MISYRYRPHILEWAPDTCPAMFAPCYFKFNIPIANLLRHININISRSEYFVCYFASFVWYIPAIVVKCWLITALRSNAPKGRSRPYVPLRNYIRGCPAFSLFTQTRFCLLKINISPIGRPIPYIVLLSINPSLLLLLNGFSPLIPQR